MRQCFSGLAEHNRERFVLIELTVACISVRRSLSLELSATVSIVILCHY